MLSAPLQREKSKKRHQNQKHRQSKHNKYTYTHTKNTHTHTPDAAKLFAETCSSDLTKYLKFKFHKMSFFLGRTGSVEMHRLGAMAKARRNITLVPLPLYLVPRLLSLAHLLSLPPCFLRSPLLPLLPSTPRLLLPPSVPYSSPHRANGNASGPIHGTNSSFHPPSDRATADSKRFDPREPKCDILVSTKTRDGAIPPPPSVFFISNISTTEISIDRSRHTMPSAPHAPYPFLHRPRRECLQSASLFLTLLFLSPPKKNVSHLSVSSCSLRDVGDGSDRIVTRL